MTVKTKEILVALAGNPNSGKTSLFNEIVGANQKVGNFPGVTVEKMEGVAFYKDYKIRIIDLPGIYSLTSYSPEEIVARNFLIHNNPDVVINVVDSTNLDRNLYLTSQLMDLGTNLIVSLNMIDEAENNKINIDQDQLETLLGAHLVPTSALKKTGIEDLLDHAIELHEGKIEAKKNKLNYSLPLEEKINQIAEILESEKHFAENFNSRWMAIKLLVNDSHVYSLVKDHPVWIKINPILTSTINDFEKKFETDPEMMITEERYAFIQGALKETINQNNRPNKTLSEKIDNILINRVTGLPIFAFLMWLIFQATFTLGEAPMEWIEIFFAELGSLFATYLPDGMAKSIIVDGIIAGVGGVLVFLPNIMILFFALSLLEASGYMARAAFVIDKVMHKFGLHGKSFIPMVTGFGCSVPAFMGTRTLKSESDRITTMLIIPFMSCSAKFPVYVLVIGAFFSPDQAGNVLFGIYTLGIVLALLSAKVFKLTLFKSHSEPFVMELPPYRMPTIRSLIMQMWMKASAYLRKAGSIILLASVVIWFGSNFPVDEVYNQNAEQQIEEVKSNEHLSQDDKDYKINEIQNRLAAHNIKYSVAGRVGEIIEPVIAPLGFDWRLGIALVTGFAAKEIVVSTMGTIYSVGDADETSTTLRDKLRYDPYYDKAVGLALMVFVLLYVPCISATVVFAKEAGKIKWTLIYLFYTTSVAWIISFIAYHAAKMIF